MPSLSRVLSRSLLLLALLALFCFQVVYAFASPHLKDLGSFLASGRAADHQFNPYLTYYPGVYFVPIPSLSLLVENPNLNPPLSLPIFSFFTRFQPYRLLPLWRTASLFVVLLFTLFLAFSLPIERWKALWLLALAGLWHTVELGQVYAFLFPFAVLCLIFLRRGHLVFAGLCAGVIIALKPNFAVWPFLLLFAGHLPFALSALSSAAVFTLLPLPIYGINVYAQWLDAAARYPGLSLPGNSSLPGLLARLDLELFSLPLAVGLVIYCAWLLYRRKPDPLFSSALAVLAALLVSPNAWSGYTLLLAPFLLPLRWSNLLLFGALLLCVPIFVVGSISGLSPLTYILFGSLYTIGILIILFDLLSASDSTRTMLP